MEKFVTKMYKLLYIAGGYHNKIQITLCCIAIVLMLIPFPMPVSIYFTLVIISMIAFICLKDLCEKAFLWERIVLVTYALSVTERLFKGIEYNNDFQIIFPVKLIVYLTVCLIVMVLLFTDNEKKENYWNEISLTKQLSGGVQLITRDEEGKDTYDIALCKDENNKHPVIWHGLDRFIHMLILAPTGGGKTSQVLLPLIVQDIKNKRGVIVIDPKSDLAVKTYSSACINGRQDAQYFDPISPNCPYYNVLYGDETDVTETIVTTFLTMESSHNASPYWGNMTENLLRKACMVVKRIEAAYEDPETGISSRPATLMTLNDLIHNTNGRGRDMVKELANLPASAEVNRENLDTTDWFLNSYFSEQSKTWQDTSNIRAEISRLCQNKYLKKILNPPDGVSQIDFPKILEEGRYLSISLAQGKLGALAKVLSSFLILTMERAILNRPGTEWTRTPCFLYIDEFQIVANKGFSDILEQGRSYRVSAILATQTMAEIKKGPDGEAFLHSVLANTRNKVVLAGAHYEDAKYFEEAFGSKKQWKTSYSENHQKFTLLSSQPLGNASEGERTAEEDVPYLSADDMVYKPFGTITYQLVDDKTLQRPAQGTANFLDREESYKIDLVVDEYNNRNDKIIRETEAIEEAEKKERIRKWQITKKGGAFKGDTPTIPGVKEAIRGNTENTVENKPSGNSVSSNPFGAATGSAVKPIKPDIPKKDFFDISNNASLYEDDDEI